MITHILCFIAVNGSFSMWTYWSSCTEECGTGVRNRSRDCDNPAPQFGGLDCVGGKSEEELCNTHNCPSIYFCLSLFSLCYTLAHAKLHFQNLFQYSACVS